MSSLRSKSCNSNSLSNENFHRFFTTPSFGLFIEIHFSFGQYLRKFSNIVNIVLAQRMSVIFNVLSWCSQVFIYFDSPAPTSMYWSLPKLFKFGRSLIILTYSDQVKFFIPWRYSIFWRPFWTKKWCLLKSSRSNTLGIPHQPEASTLHTEWF